MMENQKKETNQTNEIGAETFGLEISRPNVDAIADVPLLNYEKAYNTFSEEDKQRIQNLANSIKLTDHDKVMNYGAGPLLKTFEECQELLKSRRGSYAEQNVIKEVIELSKNITQSSDEFNSLLKEPNVVQKTFMKIFYGNKRSKKLTAQVLTIYDMIANLKDSYSKWLEDLETAMEEIKYVAISDVNSLAILNKYIIAGKIADKRLQEELAEAKQKYEETGIFSLEYKEMQEGYERFNRRMGDLEDGRVMYHLSIAEVMLIGKANKNTQEVINKQSNLILSILSMQLRNALLNEMVKEVVEGHKAVTKLSGEIVKRISKNVGATAEATERMLYQAIIDPNIVKESIESVLKSFEAINNVPKEMEPKLKAAREQNNELIKKLQPIVTSTEAAIAAKKVSTSTATGEELIF